MFTVYILQSQARERFYIGVTRDLGQRLGKHNRGSSKYTKPYRPWKVIYTEAYVDKREAYQREYFLKHPAGFLEKKALIEKYRLEV